MRKILLTFLVGLILLPQVSFAALTDSLVAYYKTDESSGNAADSVGGVTLTNNNTVTYGTGKILNGADFGSSNTTKYLSAANALGLTTGAFSVGFWVKVNTAPSNSTETIIAWTTSTGNLRIKVEYLDSAGTKTLRFNRSKPTVADQAINYNTTLTVGTWYYVVMTYDTTTEIGYLNASNVASGAASGTGAGQSNAINIGRNDNASNYSSVMVDEVGFWSRALTGTEITELYNGGSGFSYPFVASSASEDIIWFFF